MDNSRKSVPASTYGQEWIEFSNSAKEYERFLEAGDLRPRQLRSLELAGLAPGDVVLDMGCGRGEVSLYCAARGAQVVATDYSHDCLVLASRAKVVRSDTIKGRLQVARADSKSLPLADATVDRVLLLDVAEHLYPWELETALAEAYRVLKHGGFLVIHTLPNRWALNAGYRLARLFFRRLPADPRSEWERTVHINEQDIRGLHRTLSRVGFQARVWLEDSILDQAAWQEGGRAFPPEDLRARAYPILVNPLLRTVYRLALATPLRLILANDIFALAFKGPAPSRSGSVRWSESLACAGAG